MKIKFMMNEYILVWKLLFGAAITNEEYKLKKKLWTNFKKEYKEMGLSEWSEPLVAPYVIKKIKSTKIKIV